MLTRRRFVWNTAAAAAALALLPSTRFALAQSAGTYRNPLLGGDHPDPAPSAVGNGFYLTHSSFDYAPGLLVWHSRDLVNWTPVAAALRRYYGIVWAPYLCEYQGHFYIYFPAGGQLQVVHAEKPEGPWSEPIELGIKAIDPAHIAEGGRRFLLHAGGKVAELTADGLAAKTPPRTVFEAWPMPANIRMECTCLEGPKVLEHNGWFYLNVAEGGTAGPATSHAVVSARSRHADGPWEFSPYNPVVHTGSRDDRWLSLGHGRLVDTPDGKWYMTVHAYENGYRTLGRQLMLLPIEWPADGWFRVPPASPPTLPCRCPFPAQINSLLRTPRTTSPSPSSACSGRSGGNTTRRASPPGTGGAHAPGPRQVAERDAGSDEPGGRPFVHRRSRCGSGTGLHLGSCALLQPGALHEHSALAGGHLCPAGQRQHPQPPRKGRHPRHAAHRQRPGGDRLLLPSAGPALRRTEESAEIAGMNHNVLGGFLDVRPALCAYGTGKATFRGFKYWPEVRVPARRAHSSMF